MKNHHNHPAARLTRIGFCRVPGSDYHYERGNLVLCVGPKAVWHAYDQAGQQTADVYQQLKALHVAGIPIAAHLLPQNQG